MANYTTTIPSRYQIIVQGKDSWGSQQERELLIQRLTARFRLPMNTAGDLLDRSTAVVMKNLPQELAAARHQDLLGLGLKAQVIPMGELPAAASVEVPAVPDRYRLVVQGKGGWQTEQARHALAQKLVKVYKVPPLAALQLLDSDSFVVGTAATQAEAESQARRLQELGLPVRISAPEIPYFAGLFAMPWERWLVVGCWAFITGASVAGLCYQIPRVIDTLVVRPEKVRAWAFQNRLQRLTELRNVRWAAAFRQLKLTLSPQVSLTEAAVLTIANKSRLKGRLQMHVCGPSSKCRDFTTLVPRGATRLQYLKFLSAGRNQVTIHFNNRPKLVRSLATLVTLPPAMSPVSLPPGVKLGGDPKDWHVVVNVFWSPPRQWQYSSYVYRGVEVQRFLISSGAWGKPTPLGEFTVVNHMWAAVSTIYHSVMPFWNGLSSPTWGTGAFGLHALQGSSYMYALGSPASHGCIRHSPGAAHWIYDHVPINTKVTILSKREYVDPPPAPSAAPSSGRRARR